MQRQAPVVNPLVRTHGPSILRGFMGEAVRRKLLESGGPPPTAASGTSHAMDRLELVPDDVRARILLAVGYAHVGKTDDTVRELQRAIALRPNDGNTLYNATCVCGVLGKADEALDMLERALRPGNANYDWCAPRPGPHAAPLRSAVPGARREDGSEAGRDAPRPDGCGIFEAAGGLPAVNRICRSRHTDHEGSKYPVRG